MHFCLGVIYQNNIIFKTTRIQGETQVVTAPTLIFIIMICILGPLRPNLLAPVECTSTVITPVHGPNSYSQLTTDIPFSELHFQSTSLH